MTNILITGGTGFIGVPLVKQLYNLGHNLKLTIRENSNIEPFEGLNNIEFIKADVTDIDSIEKAAEGVDLIYHLAANVQIWAKNKSEHDKVNVKGTENVAKVALDKKKRLIYMSSLVALGPSPKGCEEPVDESHDVRPPESVLIYEHSKYDARQVIKKYIEQGLNTTVVYPGVVYGPGDFNIFGEMLLDIVNRKFLGCPGKGDSIGNFAYLDDVIDVMAKLVDRDDLKGEDFILGGENIEFIEYLNMIADIAGVKKPRHFPMWAAKFYGLLCELGAKITKKVPYITRRTLESMKFNRELSSKKAIDKLGYKITPIREGLEKTIEWYKDYIEKNKKKKD